jgi:hypothetical protein
MPIKSKYRNLPQFANGGAVAMADAPSPVIDEDPSWALAQQISALRNAEAQAAKPKPVPQPVQDDLAQALEKTALPGVAKDWLKAHPEYILDEDKNRQIAQLHEILLDDDIQPYGEKYFQEIERRLLGSQGEVYQSGNSKIILDGPKRDDTHRVAYNQAPPSRGDTVASRYWSGESTDPRTVTMNLTPAERGAAAISGVSLEEYARQLIRFRREKADGSIQ